MTSRSLASKFKIFTGADRAEDRDPAAVAEDLDHVIAVSGVHGEVSASPSPVARRRGGEIDVDLSHIGPAEIADHDVVGAAECIEVDRLDVVEVHGDVGDVAEEVDAPAIGRDVDVLGDNGAVEQHGVEPGLAFKRVVVVTRVPDERVVACAHEGDVVTIPAVEQVVALAPEENVVTEAAVQRQLDYYVSLKAAGVDDVVAPESVERQLIIRSLREEHVHRRLETEDRDSSSIADDAKNVSTLGGVHGDGICRSIAAPQAARSMLTCGHVGSTEIADHDVVGAAQRIEVDALDVVEVHGDVGDVASEEHPPAVGHDVDVLGDISAEEQHGVESVLTFNGVVAVARIPLEHIVTRAEEGNVVAVVAKDEIVAVAAEKNVGALAAEDNVVARTAVDGQLQDAGWQGRGSDAVVPAKAVDRRAYRSRFPRS